MARRPGTDTDAIAAHNVGLVTGSARAACLQAGRERARTKTCPRHSPATQAPHSIRSEPRINSDRLAKIVGTDWGWYTTVSDSRLIDLGAAAMTSRTWASRSETVCAAASSEPTSLSRATTLASSGPRQNRPTLPWYELPEVSLAERGSGRGPHTLRAGGRRG